jgi:type II secretory pathway pseudopilin PulG
MARLPNPAARSGGFTFIEFLVGIGLIAILVAILIPYLLTAREMSRRTECRARLGKIGFALLQYANDNGSKFPLPETVYDSVHKPEGYTAFTGPDDPHPFAKDSAVKPNDVTASLWLLVRGGYVRDLAVFICPSTTDEADRLDNVSGAALRRGNFRRANNLSYSYASPFTDAFDFAFTTDRLPHEFAILADKNPGFNCDGTRVIGPTWDAAPFELARGNSANHQHAGQNVLYPAGNVSFETTPYCGVSRDNIYTALAPHRLAASHPALETPGYLGPDIGAAYQYDSYLVPTAQDGPR